MKIVLNPMDRSRFQAFTLIEMLVTIGLIALLTALLIPAVQAARESSRKIQCANNLRQIGLALNGYVVRDGAYPMGSYYHFDKRLNVISPYCLPLVDRSFLVSILPEMEMKDAFNSLNTQAWILMPENTSSHSLLISSYICPSDSLAHEKIPSLLTQPIPDFEKWTSSFPSPIARTSYAGLASDSLYRGLPDMLNGCRIPPESRAFSNGIITSIGPVTPGSITDGTSNTLLVAEKALTHAEILRTYQPGVIDSLQWWFLGGNRTLIQGMFPPNSSKNLPPPPDMSFGAIRNSASSMHSGGLNVLFADGSGRFIRETIQSSSSSLITIGPSGGSGGVWQALITRNGGEVISADAY
jgi:prepilin-type processing-associated H-X9-DG protein/prepilin-type N-terminal cleavage/methylation domain-containing protein